MDYNLIELPNGATYIHCPSSARVAHLCVYLNAGSRDKQEQEQGMAHFIEHMAFKGTRRRKAYHILSRLDHVGGDMNAFTTKEHTCLYASFLHGFEGRATDLFSDIILHSVFPEKEIEKEKGIVLDEINTYLDTPSESIFDDFEELLFPNHPLGRNILGTPESVREITRRKIFRFIQRNYRAQEMVIAYCGPESSTRMSASLTKQFENLLSNGTTKIRQPFKGLIAQRKVCVKETHQAHAITGIIAYPLGHPRTTALHFLNNMIGGPGSSSRLNMALRERRGYTYHVESNYQPYSDTGYFNIYLGTAEGKTEAALAMVQKELSVFTRDKLGTLQLHRAKMQFTGQLALSFESKLSEILSVGKRMLHQQHIATTDEIISRINALTADDILETARELFHPHLFSTLIYSSPNHAS
jgi:predicted Zn-dependent peptidase